MSSLDAGTQVSSSPPLAQLDWVRPACRPSSSTGSSVSARLPCGVYPARDLPRWFAGLLRAIGGGGEQLCSLSCKRSLRSGLLRVLGGGGGLGAPSPVRPLVA